jgi:hypothetical protein
MEASLSGWFCVTSTAWFAPKMTTLAVAKQDEQRERDLEVRLGQVDVAFLEQVPRADAQHQRGADRHDAMNTCMIRGMNDGVKTTSQKLVITARVGAGSVAIV